jgi:alanine racemase
MIRQHFVDSDHAISLTLHLACADEKDLYMQLSVLKQQLKQKFKQETSFEGEEIEFSNAYGTHEAVLYWTPPEDEVSLSGSTG